MKNAKKLFAMLLAVLLASALPLRVRADVWIPPDDMTNEYILSAPYVEGDCYVINAFVSNFAEANLTDYYRGGAGDEVAATVLKHMELNAGLYTDYMTQFTGADGKRYMRIDAGKYQNKVWDLFHIWANAEDCPGYADGAITVSAENFGGPIYVMAAVDNISYSGSGMYDMSFTVYHVPGGVNSQYGIPSYQLAEQGYEVYGTGYARFYFGSATRTDFRSADLELQVFYMELNSGCRIPGSAPNLPQPEKTQPGPGEETEPPTTQPEETEGETVVNETEEQPEETPEFTYPVQEQGETAQGSFSLTGMLAFLVAAVSLVALASVFLIFRKEK